MVLFKVPAIKGHILGGFINCSDQGTNQLLKGFIFIFFQTCVLLFLKENSRKNSWFDLNKAKKIVCRFSLLYTKYISFKTLKSVLLICANWSQNPRLVYRITGSSRLKEIFKVVLSNSQPSSTIITPKPHPQVPQPDTS